MNFNFATNEYNLVGSMSDELIRIYGIKCKFVVTTKTNIDDTFGDFSHLDANNKNVFEVYLMPENSESYDSFERLQTQFNIPMDTTINFFMSKNIRDSLYENIYRSDFDAIVKTEDDNDISFLFSSLIILPSGKIVEITDVDFEVVGLNNLYAYNNNKNLFRLKCRTYVHKNGNNLDIDTEIDDEKNNIDNINIAEIFEPSSSKNNHYEDTTKKLDDYFSEVMKKSDEQDKEASEFADFSKDYFDRF